MVDDFWERMAAQEENTKKMHERLKKADKLKVGFHLNGVYEKRPWILIRQYAAACYTYEMRDFTIMSDGVYDKLCFFLKKHYKIIKQYDINGYVVYADLSTTTGSGVAHRVCGLTLRWAEKEMLEIQQDMKRARSLI